MHNNVSNMTRIENSGVVGEENRGFEGPSSSNTDAFTVKRIMGRTPGLIKSKFLSVLDSSNGILHGISSKVGNSLLSPISMLNPLNRIEFSRMRVACSSRGSV